MSFRPHSRRASTPRAAARIALACLPVLALAGCADLLNPSEKAPEAILFLRHADPGGTEAWNAKTDIYRMNADGTGVENLTALPAAYVTPRLSPDGRKVAFASNRSGSMQVWVMNTDGSGTSQLTTGFANTAPRWSPDGTLIAYERHDPDAGAHVYVMNADGSGPRNVSLPAAGGGCSSTDTRTRIALIGWISAGRIAFSRYFCGYGYRFYTVDADGSGFAPSDLDLNDAWWSPDGSRVAFIRLDGSRRKLFVMNADGSGARRLADQGTDHHLPPRTNPHLDSDYTPWSPDGRRIMFFADTSSAHYPQAHCGSVPYVIDVDGSDLRQLAGFCGAFNGWSPGGDRIALTHWDGGSSDVYVADVGSGGLVNLTSTPVRETSALWLTRR